MPGFILDLDGTLYNGNMTIPHAAEFLQWLDERNYPYLLVTNNSSRTPEQVSEHMHALGMAVGPERVLTSAQAACLHLRDMSAGRRVYCIGEQGIRQALAEAGFTLTEERPDFVVQGIDRELSYAKLAAAVSHIRAGARYILTNPDMLLPWNGVLTPGAGAIGAAIQAASGVVPVVIGKPSPIIMRYAIERLQLAPDDIWVVGDNANTDIRGGAAASCRTALVLTGLATRETADEQLAAAGVSADAVCDDLLALRRLLEDKQG